MPPNLERLPEAHTAAGSATRLVVIGIASARMMAALIAAKISATLLERSGLRRSLGMRPILRPSDCAQDVAPQFCHRSAGTSRAGAHARSAKLASLTPRRQTGFATTSSAERLG